MFLNVKNKINCQGKMLFVMEMSRNFELTQMWKSAATETRTVGKRVVRNLLEGRLVSINAK